MPLLVWPSVFFLWNSCASLMFFSYILSLCFVVVINSLFLHLSLLKEEWSCLSQEFPCPDVPISDRIWKHLSRRIDHKVISVKKLLLMMPYTGPRFWAASNLKFQYLPKSFLHYLSKVCRYCLSDFLLLIESWFLAF